VRVGVIAAAVLVAALLGLAQGAGGADGAVAPTLRVVGTSPFTVRGTFFKPGERVTVTMVAGKRLTARASANARGTFTVKFKVPVTRCTKYSLKAAGTLGSRATFTPRLSAACKPKATVEFGATVAVKGTNFTPGERVTVTLAADETWTGKAVVNAKGAFTVDLGALPLSDCSAYKLSVAGSRGSRFTFTHPTAPC
jgi:hypothetical protein